jgi:hypothetical protein
VADLFFTPDGTLLPNEAPNAAVAPSPAPQQSAAQPYFAQDGTALMEPPPYASAPASAEERVAAGEAIHPLEMEALQYKRMHQLGYEFGDGQSARPAGWVDIGREGAIAEPPEQFAERQALAERGRGIVRDERDIQYEDNERLRAIADEQAAQAKERAFAKESRLQTIDDEVRRESVALDSQMQQYRRMVSEGIDPWKAYGGGNFSGKISAALSLATAALGTQEGADRSMRLFETLTKNEIQKQMYEMETQGSMVDNTYGRLRNLYGDKDQAEAALNALMLDAAKYEIERSLLETADPAAKANADKLILGIDQMLLEQNDAFRVRAQGKVTQRYDQGQAASAGGWRRMTPKGWNDYLKGNADISGTEAGTQKTYADIGKVKAEAAPLAAEEKLIASVPTDVRKAVIGASNLASKLDRVAKLLGMGGYDQDTGQVMGDFPLDIPGAGPLDRMTVDTYFGSEEGKHVSNALRDLGYSAFRQDHGANYTGIEATKLEPLQPGGKLLESNVKAAIQHIAERVADTRNANIKALPPSQQAAFLNHLKSQETASPEAMGLRKR